MQSCVETDGSSCHPPLCCRHSVYPTLFIVSSMGMMGVLLDALSILSVQFLEIKVLTQRIFHSFYESGFELSESIFTIGKKKDKYREKLKSP